MKKINIAVMCLTLTLTGEFSPLHASGLRDQAAKLKEKMSQGKLKSTMEYKVLKKIFDIAVSTGVGSLQQENFCEKNKGVRKLDGWFCTSRKVMAIAGKICGPGWSQKDSDFPDSKCADKSKGFFQKKTGLSKTVSKTGFEIKSTKNKWMSIEDYIVSQITKKVTTTDGQLFNQMICEHFIKAQSTLFATAKIKNACKAKGYTIEK